MQSTSIDEKYIYENFVKIALIGFKSSIGYLQKDILYGNYQQIRRIFCAMFTTLLIHENIF